MKTIEELLNELPTYIYLVKKKEFETIYWCMERKHLSISILLLEQEYKESLESFLTRCLNYLEKYKE